MLVLSDAIIKGTVTVMNISLCMELFCCMIRPTEGIDFAPPVSMHGLSICHRY